jgi:Salmonella virulence plasmid 65kDa B protein
MPLHRTRFSPCVCGSNQNQTLPTQTKDVMSNAATQAACGAIARYATAALLTATLSFPVHATGNHTGAQFAVTESGAATLTVPIQVPRGIGGMEPQLSLNYSSGAGNGLFGLGWTLSGPSAITRCAKTILHDGERGAVTFGKGDRFCLDGQRLMLVPFDPSAAASTVDNQYGLPGTTYRTDKDSFSRITAMGSHPHSPHAPVSFKVETKSGLIMHFGSSTDSQVPVNDPTLGTARPVNRWMLERIEDRNGSFVKFLYCAGEVSDSGVCVTSQWQGSTVLHYIQYTGRTATASSAAVSGTSAVVLAYEPRPDRVPQFHFGGKTVQSQRVSRIDSYVGFVGLNSPGTKVRSYLMGYEPISYLNQRATIASRLISIQETDGSSAPGPTGKLPPLEFVYGRDLVSGKGFVTNTLPDVPPPQDCGPSGPGATQQQCF